MRLIDRPLQSALSQTMTLPTRQGARTRLKTPLDLNELGGGIVRHPGIVGRHHDHALGAQRLADQIGPHLSLWHMRLKETIRLLGREQALALGQVLRQKLRAHRQRLGHPAALDRLKERQGRKVRRSISEPFAANRRHDCRSPALAASAAAHGKASAGRGRRRQSPPLRKHL